jgi:WD40 repeat protein
MLVSVSIGSLASLVSAATPGYQLWVKRYDGPANGEESAKSVAVSPDGSKVFVTGYSEGSTTSYDYATVAYDASTGAKLWVKRYDGTGDFDVATALGMSSDGSKVFVTGYSLGSATYYNYATVAYDAHAVGEALRRHG